MELFDISTETILKSLWFACSSSSQTYERTKLSRQNPITHLWRIFTGKVGELFFLEYLWKKGFIKDDEYAKLEENSLSVWWKKHNVDLCDIKIGNYLIDVKTLPESTHRYLIIPKDQYDNNPKDFYFCLILFHNLSGEKVKKVQALLEENQRERGRIEKSNHQYLLKGKVRCGSCKSFMTPKSAKSGKPSRRRRSVYVLIKRNKICIVFLKNLSYFKKLFNIPC